MPNIGTPDSVFIKIAKDCLYEMDKKPYKGPAEPKDVIDFYIENSAKYEDLIRKATNGARSKIGGSTFYTRPKLIEYLEALNKKREMWVADSILENDQYVFEEFNWKDFMQININRKDLGFSIVGEIINLHRNELRKLISANQRAEESYNKISASYEELLSDIERLKKELEKATEKKKESLERLQEVRDERDALKSKFYAVKKYLDLKEEQLIEIKNNASRGIPTIPDEFYQKHSYLGEPDQKTPSLRELNERFGVEEEPEAFSFSSDDYESIT